MILKTRARGQNNETFECDCAVYFGKSLLSPCSLKQRVVKFWARFYESNMTLSRVSWLLLVKKEDVSCFFFCMQNTHVLIVSFSWNFPCANEFDVNIIRKQHVNFHTESYFCYPRVDTHSINTKFSFLVASKFMCVMKHAYFTTKHCTWLFKSCLNGETYRTSC